MYDLFTQNIGETKVICTRQRKAHQITQVNQIYHVSSLEPTIFAPLELNDLSGVFWVFFFLLCFFIWYFTVISKCN